MTMYSTVTKMYYTDPLAAAYMAREFGVTFFYPHGYLAENEKVPLKCGGEYRVTDASIQVFEPKVGDLVKLDSIQDVLQYKNENKERVITGYTTRRSPFHEFLLLDNEGKTRNFNLLVTKIIQRDGKPFFWPEVENAA